MFHAPEAATRGVLQEMMFLKIRKINWKTPVSESPF